VAEHKREYERMRDALVKAAQLARDNAVSYRETPFLVGCAVMGWKDNDEDYVIRTAGNFTPTKAPPEEPYRGSWRGKEKRCAERNALDAIQTDHPNGIVAIVTASREKSTDPHASADHDVLHPCHDCLEYIQDLLQQGIIKPDTIIYNVNDTEEPDEDESVRNLIGEERTIARLLAMYSKEEKK